MSLAESQDFFYHLCVQPRTIKDFKTNRHKVLKQYFKKEADREYLSGYAVERFETYRNHISFGILGSIASAFPVIRSLLSDKEWNDLLNTFYLKRLTKSPIARRVFQEFFLFLQKTSHPSFQTLLKKFPYLRELAGYEALDLRLLFEPEKKQTRHRKKLKPFGKIPLLNPHLEMNVYLWPVHLICTDFSSRKEVKKGRYPLIVYREPQSQKVRFMESNLLVAEMICRMSSGRASSEGILRSLAKQFQLSPDSKQAFFDEGKKTITFLHEKGVVIGFR